MSYLDFLIFFSDWEFHNAFDNIDISFLRSNRKGCIPVLMRQPYAIIRIKRKEKKQNKLKKNQNTSSK
jgi:hypothetical protein